MDGTFTREIFDMTILLAVTVGAGGRAVILAWAVVQGGSESSWRYVVWCGPARRSFFHNAGIVDLYSPPMGDLY